VHERPRQLPHDQNFLVSGRLAIGDPWAVLRELHLGIPRPNPDAPRPSEQLQSAYDAAMSTADAP
jgi:hypothetical protein